MNGGQTAASPAGIDDGSLTRKTLEERLEEMKTKARDCRKCRAFRQDESGLGFGWCTAFEQYVKLYHPEGGFWSQCQFKVISKSTAPASPDGTAVPVAKEKEADLPAKQRSRNWIPVPATDTPASS